MILDQIVEKRKQQLLKEQSAIGLEEMKALAMQVSPFLTSHPSSKKVAFP